MYLSYFLCAQAYSACSVYFLFYFYFFSFFWSGAGGGRGGAGVNQYVQANYIAKQCQQMSWTTMSKKIITLINFHMKMLYRTDIDNDIL